MNVAAGAPVAAEFIQNDCSGPALAEALEALIADPARAAAQVSRQAAALATMRGGIDDPVEAAADAVLADLNATTG